MRKIFRFEKVIVSFREMTKEKRGFIYEIGGVFMTKVRDDISFEEIRERMKPLLEDEGLKLVLLFGSAASGRTHKQSDIDLAFLYDKPVDILLLTNRIISILRSDTIDVIDMRRASPLLKFAIARNCVLLYEKESFN